MIRGICLSTVAFMMLAAPAFAQDAAPASTCMDPMVPTMPDGATAPAADIRAAATSVTTYVKEADDYQLCLNVEFNALVEQNKKEKKVMSGAENRARIAKINASQKAKEDLGKAYGVTAADYRKAHPPAPR